MRLLLVRHGLSSFNCENRIQGRDDLSILTKDGIHQAELTGKSLKEISIAAVYSSPLRRAASTAKKIIEGKGCELHPIFEQGLLEVDLSPWSGLTVNEVRDEFPQDFKAWKERPQDLIINRGDGTSFKPIQQLLQQANEFLKELTSRHPPEKKETVLIVAHNAILRCLIINLLGQPHDSFRKLKIDNASISVFNLLSVSDNRVKAQLECLNSTVHLNQPLPKRTKRPRIILVRHGETNWNKEGRFQGQIDIPLNRTGHSQANAVSRFLSTTNVNKAYSSPMVRPTETAQAIINSHEGLELSLEDELMEINHGLWEGKLESEIARDWPLLLEKWKKSPQEVVMPEGESIQEVWERSVICWKRICTSLQQEETALVVAHDAVNKTILCHLLGLKESDIWLIKQGNGGVTVIDISNDPSEPDIVTCLNLTSHLGGIIDETAAGAL